MLKIAFSFQKKEWLIDEDIHVALVQLMLLRNNQQNEKIAALKYCLKLNDQNCLKSKLFEEENIFGALDFTRCKELFL